MQTLTAEQLQAKYGRRAIWLHERTTKQLDGLSGAEIAAIIGATGYDTVYIKAGNGGYASPASGSERWPRQWNTDFIQGFLDNGIKVCAWVYIYAWGRDSKGYQWLGPEAEAKMLPYIKSVYDCPIIVDAEYELIGQQDNTQLFADHVQEYGIPPEDLAYAPDLRIAFNNEWPGRTTVVDNGGRFPWQTLNGLCGAVLPQTYFHAFSLDANTGAFRLIDRWRDGYPDAPPVLPIFDQGSALNEAIIASEHHGYPSHSVWLLDTTQTPLPPLPPQPQADELNVGEGIRSQMQANGDRPIMDSEWGANQDGTLWERNWGTKGIYIASNATGEWKSYGPLPGETR